MSMSLTHEDLYSLLDDSLRQDFCCGCWKAPSCSEIDLSGTSRRAKENTFSLLDKSELWDTMCFFGSRRSRRECELVLRNIFYCILSHDRLLRRSIVQNG